MMLSLAILKSNSFVYASERVFFLVSRFSNFSSSSSSWWAAKLQANTMTTYTIHFLLYVSIIPSKVVTAGISFSILFAICIYMCFCCVFFFFACTFTRAIELELASSASLNSRPWIVYSTLSHLFVGYNSFGCTALALAS